MLTARPTPLALDIDLGFAFPNGMGEQLGRVPSRDPRRPRASFGLSSSLPLISEGYQLEEEAYLGQPCLQPSDRFNPE